MSSGTKTESLFYEILLRLKDPLRRSFMIVQRIALISRLKQRIKINCDIN